MWVAFSGRFMKIQKCQNEKNQNYALEYLDSWSKEKQEATLQKCRSAGAPTNVNVTKRELPAVTVAIWNSTDGNNCLKY